MINANPIYLPQKKGIEWNSKFKVKNLQSPYRNQKQLKRKVKP
jgi:hypothetical protein